MNISFTSQFEIWKKLQENDYLRLNPGQGKDFFKLILTEFNSILPLTNLNMSDLFNDMAKKDFNINDSFTYCILQLVDLYLNIILEMSHFGIIKKEKFNYSEKIGKIFREEKDANEQIKLIDISNKAVTRNIFYFSKLPEILEIQDFLTKSEVRHRYIKYSIEDLLLQLNNIKKLISTLKLNNFQEYLELLKSQEQIRKIISEDYTKNTYGDAEFTKLSSELNEKLKLLKNSSKFKSDDQTENLKYEKALSQKDLEHCNSNIGKIDMEKISPRLKEYLSREHFSYSSLNTPEEVDKWYKTLRENLKEKLKNLDLLKNL